MIFLSHSVSRDFIIISSDGVDESEVYDEDSRSFGQATISRIVRASD